MGDTNRTYGRTDLVITFADTDPVALSATSLRFKTLRIQADEDNENNVYYGGADPKLKLIATASDTFENGDLSEFFVKGTAGEKVNINYEF